MNNKEMTTDECMEIFKKYDKETYNYYVNNMWFFGYNARNYAKKLKEDNEGTSEHLKDTLDSILEERE